MYLDVHGSDLDGIADALSDIAELIREGHVYGSGEYYGTVVAWKLNLNQR